MKWKGVLPLAGWVGLVGPPTTTTAAAAAFFFLVAVRTCVRAFCRWKIEITGLIFVDGNRERRRKRRRRRSE